MGMRRFLYPLEPVPLPTSVFRLPPGLTCGPHGYSSGNLGLELNPSSDGFKMRSPLGPSCAGTSVSSCGFPPGGNPIGYGCWGRKRGAHPTLSKLLGQLEWTEVVWAGLPGQGTPPGAAHTGAACFFFFLKISHFKCSFSPWIIIFKPCNLNTNNDVLGILVIDYV